MEQSDDGTVDSRERARALKRKRKRGAFHVFVSYNLGQDGGFLAPQPADGDSGSWWFSGPLLSVSNAVHFGAWSASARAPILHLWFNFSFLAWFLPYFPFKFFCLLPQLPKEYLSLLQTRAPSNISEIISPRKTWTITWTLSWFLSCHAWRLIVRLSSNLDLKSSSSGNKEIRNFKLNGLLV